MKINALQISNFIGARDIRVQLTRPINLFAGRNGSGKTSCMEAVRMALTGEPSRVTLKKEYGSLVTTGAKTGCAIVDHDEGRSSITLPNGKRETPPIPQGTLPYLIDAHRFAILSTDDRSKLLFGAMGVATDVEAIAERLAEKGCASDLISQIKPFFRLGFDPSHTESLARIREHKAIWRTHTGETYGSQKALTWSAPKSVVDMEKMKRMRSDMEKMDSDIEQHAARIGQLQGAKQAARLQSATIADLRAKAGRYAAIAKKLQGSEAELQRCEEIVEALRSTIMHQPSEQHHLLCPDCGSALMLDGGKLVHHVMHDVAPQATESDRLPEFERSVQMLVRTVANDKRDLAAAESAAQTLASLEEKGALLEPSEEDIAAEKSGMETIKAARKELHSTLQAMEAAARVASESETKTQRAAAEHTIIQQWEQIAAALAPDGIPGELLSDTLDPINERLASSSNIACWKRINIGPDMAIFAAEEGEMPRPYALLSESEQWRADAMLSEALAYCSGLRILVLDRFDVLDLQGREDALYWLDALSVAGEIDTALIFGTLKETPKNLPDTIGTVWIEDGIVEQINEPAAQTLASLEEASS